MEGVDRKLREDLEGNMVVERWLEKFIEEREAKRIKE